MASRERFSDARLEALRAAKILGVRAGREHRHTGVWPVVVEDRLFVRSWNDADGGWFQAFRADPEGSIRVAGQEVAVRALSVRSQRLRQAVTEAFAAKYDTKGRSCYARGVSRGPCRRLPATTPEGRGPSVAETGRAPGA